MLPIRQGEKYTYFTLFLFPSPFQTVTFSCFTSEFRSPLLFLVGDSEAQRRVKVFQIQTTKRRDGFPQ